MHKTCHVLYQAALSLVILRICVQAVPKVLHTFHSKMKFLISKHATYVFALKQVNNTKLILTQLRTRLWQKMSHSGIGEGMMIKKEQGLFKARKLEARWQYLQAIRRSNLLLSDVLTLVRNKASKGKEGKIFHVHATEVYGGSRYTTPHILNLDIRRR